MTTTGFFQRLHTDSTFVRRVSLVLFLWAVLVRLVIFVSLGSTVVTGGAGMGEMSNVARTLSERGAFADPIREKVLTGPTAYVAPGFAAFLALQMHFSPSREFFKTLSVCLAALVISIVWGSLPWLSYSLGLGAAVGLLGGLYGATNPLYHWLDFEGSWDQNYTALLLALLLLWSYRRLRPDAGLRVFVVGGLLWGGALLFQPTTGMALAAFGVSSLLYFGFSAHWLYRGYLVMAVVMVLVVLPWEIRTRVALGAWVPTIRSTLPLELAVSFNDDARPLIADNLYHSGVRHPSLNMEEARLYARLGELSYMESRRHDAFSWISQHPRKTVELILARMGYFWVPLRLGMLRRAPEFLVTISAFIGLYLIRKQRRVFLLFACLWLFYPLIYYLTQNDERYRYPINWSIVLLAGVTWVSVLRAVFPVQGAVVAPQPVSGQAAGR